MKGRELQKFKKHHQWCLKAPSLFYPTAAILCSEIQAFPEAVDYVRSELDAGRLYIDLHGWEHVDYAKLPLETIEEHLDKSFEYLIETFGCLPIRWATPWGSNSEAIETACRKYSLLWEGVEDTVIDQGPAMALVKEAGTLAPLRDRVIMVHWFERGLKLYRIVQTGVHGTWEEAVKAHPELFETKETA
jgi:peptidoglycan/xylan/chitin deacetylase (PgdA/CDA1 family)